MNLDDRSTRTGMYPAVPGAVADRPAHRPPGVGAEKAERGKAETEQEKAEREKTARPEGLGKAERTETEATASGRLRERWQEALLSFVDDPREAVRQADQVLDDAVNQLTAAVRREQERLRAAWREDGDASTDTLREALRGYRDFLERVVATPR
ncbi:hypothetical protein Ga0074812_13862 [Parafrankia irregularis]|uniref:Uncharacterized protein n=1 Tax=Parafrankia irregularis TaxID=795642 RepID=A0A0S4QXG6_9ACTN|nr:MULTISPECIES: hypothetical protein [Parafrankia]MBE3201473.1 hypothetical protein [Parafrankia sp. CH37]CUU60347.1 hypothetical protein Ga0074812_13862 [Parafrankia irregularis]